MLKKHITKFFLAFALTGVMSMNANALVVDYAGTVLASTGALATLVPPGTAVGGPVSYDDAAVATGTVGPAGILSIDINVGGFCFSTGPDVSGCPLGGALVPVSSIDAAAVTFAGTTPTGGFLDVTTFSPSFGIFIPISFDLTAGTFLATSPLGDASGTFAPAVVPVPAAVWFMGSALLGLVGMRRRS